MNKQFYVKTNIGRAKYTISCHDGTKFHKDGSKFFDIEIFSNKKLFNKCVKNLLKENFVEI